jgi:hypothetical protein
MSGDVKRDEYDLEDILYTLSLMFNDKYNPYGWDEETNHQARWSIFFDEVLDGLDNYTSFKIFHFNINNRIKYTRTVKLLREYVVLYKLTSENMNK